MSYYFEYHCYQDVPAVWRCYHYKMISKHKFTRTIFIRDGKALGLMIISGCMPFAENIISDADN